MINGKNFEENKKTPFLTSCDAQTHNFRVFDDIGITHESLQAKNGQELPISHIWAYASFVARQGFKVFPLHRRDKKPLFSGWQEKATDDENVIQGWGENYPNHNYGVPTGNGWFVLDFDLDESDDIDEEIQRVRDKLGSFGLGTLVKTGRGYQLYCNCDGFDIRNSPKRLTDKVDIKGAGGYVVGPGSIHPNGTRYEFCDVRTLSDGIKLTKLPEAALQYIVSLQESRGTTSSYNDNNLRGANSPESRTRGNALDYAKPIPEGERNDTLFRIGCHYREVNRLQTSGIYAILKEINFNDCEVPVGDSELQGIAESCGSFAPGAPTTAVEPKVNEECSEEVHGLFQDNKLIELFRRNVQKFHVGDEPVAELLMLSVASLSVINTNGLQPKLSGESGMGKTHGTKTVLHLMHPTIYRAASFSSKALFYDDTLRPKMVIFSDDVNLAPDVEETVRAAMTNWDSPTEHMTLDGKRNPITLSLPPRVAFWLTSVSTKSTMQLLNRQVEMNVDESPDQDKRVEQHQRRLAESGLPDFYEDNEVELTREALLRVNRVDFAVKIPFIDNIRFTDVRNRRNLPIFLDFVKAYCILNYMARQTDEDGALIATKQDFENALELFKTVAIQQVTKLNEKERLVASVIRDNSPCDIPTIMDKTKLSNSYIFELIHGPYKSDNRGMLEKIPELKFYSKSDVDPETGDRWGRNHYALPAEWTLVKSYESIVYWEDDVGGTNQLRSVSDYFGDDFRNSENGGEESNSRLGRVNGHIVHNTDTTFGTSEEYKTPLHGTPTPALYRSSETEINDKWNRPTAAPKPETDTQTAIRSISEARSEVDRSASKIDNTSSFSDAADEPQDLSQIPQLIYDYLNDVKQQQRGKKLRQDLLRSMVANKVNDLSDNRYSVTKVLGCYDRLNSEDARISALINSICGGEPSVCSAS